MTTRERAIARVGHDAQIERGVVSNAMTGNNTHIIYRATRVAVKGWERAIVAEGLLKRAERALEDLIQHCGDSDYHRRRETRERAHKAGDEIRSFLSAEDR